MSEWFTIARLLPAHLGLNGSAANAEIVARSLRELGHDVTIVDVNDPSEVVSSVDLVCVGSGSTSQLRPAATALLGLVRTLNQWRSSGAFVFANGMGWDLLGRHVLAADGDEIPGCGVFPSTADLRVPRFSGEVAGRDYLGRSFAGYVNQVGSSTRDEGVSALGRIELSAGNYPPDEGLIGERVMATRVGGPALALNPHWCNDIVSDLVASRGLTFAPTAFHDRVRLAAENARALIVERLQSSSR